MGGTSAEGPPPQPLPPVPRAGCRDCGLQDTSWSKEVLDRLYTSNFGEPLESSTPFNPFQVRSL